MKRENYEQWDCKKLHVWGLFKNVQMQGVQKSEPRGVYLHTLSGAVCSATPHMGVFQQPLRHFENLDSIRRPKLEHFLRQSSIDGNIGKFQRGRIAHNIIEAYLQNIKIVFVNGKHN